MARLPQIAAAVIVAGAFAPFATAQAPPAPRSRHPPPPGSHRPSPANRPPGPPRHALAAADLPPERRPPVRLSVLRDAGADGKPIGLRVRADRYQVSAGYRNPGGVGRYLEYYPPGNEFQVERDPVRVARFGEGGVPDRDEQRAAQQVGIQRYNSIQQHIDSYAHPYGFGYGFGFGAFGGFN